MRRAQVKRVVLRRGRTFWHHTPEQLARTLRVDAELVRAAMLARLTGSGTATVEVPGLGRFVVGDARATWVRIRASLTELRGYGLDHLLLPVQDGSDIASTVALARECGAGIFVGGSGWAYKYRALVALARHDVRWVHVGRASSIEQLQICAELGADAVDSTSFLRAQHANVRARARYRSALVEYAHLRQSPIHEGHYPAPARACEQSWRLGYYDEVAP